MKYIFTVLFSILFFSCTTKSDLGKNFNCTSKIQANTKTFSDFKKNYTINIPKHWKTSLFYNSTESSIFAADTTKQLSETYILKTSFNYGELDVDNSLKKKTDSLLISNLQQKNSEYFLKFNELPAYAYTTNFTKQNFDITHFQMYIKLNNASYLLASIEIYGKSNVEKRLCEGISLINSIKISQ